MNYKIYLFFALIIFFNPAFAQFSDSLQLNVGVTATVADKGYLPLWLVSNKWGTISDRQADLGTNINLYNAHFFETNKRNRVNANTKNNKIYLKYGLNLYLNNHFKNLFLEQLYVKAGFKNLEVRAGRFEELIGVVDPELSTGSMGISGNALPIPKIGLAVTKFTDVPFTNGWVQFKGTFNHGWLGKNNYLKSAFLHDKSFFLRFGKSRLRVILGGQHFVEWAGQRQDLKLGRSFNDFTNVVFVKWANDGSFANPNYTGSFAGDHRITVEGAVQWEGEKAIINVYQQSPFESGDGFSFRSVDALRGVAITFREKKLVTKIVGEFIHTKQMFDFVEIRRRETYYNNWTYKTGWEYNNQIIGTPLFINRVRGRHYFSSIKPYDWSAPADSVPRNGNIINNRIIGFNMGLSGMLAKSIKYKAMFTYTRNFGTHYEGPFSDSPKNQFYSKLEVVLPIYVKNMEFRSAVGYDWGQLTNNVGLQLSALWKLK